MVEQGRGGEEGARVRVETDLAE
uniref:Uncharacterized protein n=1 Tax=Arundo donax TaxID=35708 RepID=A0A0A9EZY7_ARUDO